MAKSIDIDGYTIIKRIGTGARSVIYLAKDDITGDRIALKRAKLESPEDTRIFEQMDTEYRVSRLVNHQYVRKCHKMLKKRKLLRVHEVLLTMEMFEGKTLEDSTSLSLGDILLLFRMVADGLNAMHQAGYVHCDIKPNNILINKEGNIKIIDLGQSCKIGQIKTRIQGTPDYIAPEQVNRQHISHRTDIFNLGATMYWALTGKNVPTLISRKIEAANHLPPQESRPPHEVYSKIPLEVSQIVMDCVEEKPSDRPASMAEIISRLDVMIRNIFGNRLEKNVTTNS